jgi:hypothetical protein
MLSIGYCEDSFHDESMDDGAPMDLTHVKYTESLPDGGSICEGCLESWEDEQEFNDANRPDALDAGDWLPETVLIGATS